MPEDGMPSEDSTNNGSATGSHRLPAAVFYGAILAGIILGAVICGIAAWMYLDAGEREPTSRRIWGDVAREFVIPIALMMGSTFGGLASLTVAVICERRLANRAS